MNSKLLAVLVGALFLLPTACLSEESADKPAQDQLLQAPKRLSPANVPPPAPETPSIDAVALKERVDSKQKTTIVCARSADSEPLIKGAIRVDEDSIVTWSDKMPKDAFIAIYCTCPEDQASKRSVRQLRENGFENAFVLENGLKGWLAIGGPTTGGSSPATKGK